MSEIWLAPYLPLAPSEERIGPWRLVPFRAFEAHHARDQGVYEKTSRLIAAYKLQKALPIFGAVVFPDGGRVGDDLAREGLQPLRRALATTLIDMNPSPFTDGEEHPNAGHMVASADNGLVFTPRLGDGDMIVTTEGAFLEKVDIRVALPGGHLPVIPPPPALPTPILGTGVDAEYASAVYATLTHGDRVARQLDRAIQWQATAWTNTQFVGDDTRVLAFRAAFDVLLGGNASTRENGTALATLLDDTTEARERRFTAHDKVKTPSLNDTEWWFQSFALLRNAIAHGSEIDASMWSFDGEHHHLLHADDHLRRALKQTVVNATGQTDLMLSRFSRSLRRKSRESLAMLTDSSSPDSV